MKITIELLERREAPVQVLDYVERKGLDGADITKIMESGAPYEILHFFRNNFSVNEEEYLAYLKGCNIEDSKSLYNSDNVTSSYVVSESSHIVDSSYIFNSTDVQNGLCVYNSSTIKNGTDINYGKDIARSSRIYDCFNITDTSGALNSDFISWSENISFSSYIEDSKFIYKSHNLIDAYFCGFCEGSAHLLFCSGIQNENYMIFNRKVSIQTFEEAREKLLFMLNTENPQFLKVDQTTYLENRINVNYRFDAVFDGLSANFYGRVGNFENYSDDVFIELFFKERN